MRVSTASSRPGENRMYELEVQSLTGKGLRRSVSIWQVPYSQLNACLQRLGQTGGRLLRITPASAATAPEAGQAAVPAAAPPPSPAPGTRVDAPAGPPSQAPGPQLGTSRPPRPTTYPRRPG